MCRRNLPTKTVHLLQLWRRPHSPRLPDRNQPPSPTKQSHEKHPLRSRDIPDKDEFEGWSDVEEIYAPAVPDEDPEDRNVTLPRPTHGREETGRTLRKSQPDPELIYKAPGYDEIPGDEEMGESSATAPKSEARIEKRRSSGRARPTNTTPGTI